MPDLYHRLRAAGVFSDPARRIAYRYRNRDPDDVLIALRAHALETGNLAIAVWRLDHGYLYTGGKAVDQLIDHPITRA
jgi:hypothetical protein